ncbi:MAG: tetratricopeptide (TPR) repeat protein [Kiritimatiellia bacterium]|jgi:tetratricopeptide (TPR) repeat protein
MRELPKPSNIYETHSPADPVPEKIYADLPLTKSKSITRNRMLTGSILLASIFLLAFWYTVIYSSPNKDTEQVDSTGYQPTYFGLSQGVEAAEGNTNGPIYAIDVSNYLPADWGHLPTADEIANRAEKGVNTQDDIPELTSEIKDPNDIAQLLSRVAEQFIEQEKYDLAEAQLMTALDHRPGDLQCMRLLGTIYTARGEYEAAVDHYLKLINRDPYKEECYNNIAVAYIHQGHYDLAEEKLNLALKTNANFYDAHVNLALLYTHRGRNDLVVKQLDEIIDFIPRNTRARRYLAYSLLKIGEPYRSRAHFTELVRDIKDDPDLYFKIAECYALENDNEKAIAWLKLGADHCNLATLSQTLEQPVFTRLKAERGFQLLKMVQPEL